MIRFKNVSKIYSHDVVGLKNVNVHIRPGEFVAIVGQSGTGKTTFAKLLIAEERPTNGQIVVALLENGLATLKRFFKEKTRVRLEPANASMSPIFATKVRIQGRVVGVIRRYA